MQTAMSNQQQRQIIWSRKLAQMDHDSQVDSAKREGANELGQLVSKLLSLGRIQDVEKVSVDIAYREKLYAEFGIAE